MNILKHIKMYLLDKPRLINSITIRDRDCLKYVRILEDIYSICRQCLDDEFMRDVMLEIINKIEKGLK